MKFVGGLLNAMPVRQQALAEGISRVPIWIVADNPKYVLERAKANEDADVRAVISLRWPK